MEACNTYKPWHDKQTHRTFLRPDTGKCLHYYFYFIDAELGLIYLRVPTPACAGAGHGVRSASSSIATGIAGWPANSLPPGSVSPLPTTPSCASTIGSARRPLPMASRPTCCVASSIATPSSAVRCLTCSLSPTIGVSCRSSTPRIWCSARQPSSNPCINSFPGRPSSRSKPNTSPPSSATGSLPNSPKRSAVNSQPGPRGPASAIVSAHLRSRSTTNSASSCAWRPPPTTSPLSSTTARACPREGGGGTSAGPGNPRPRPRQKDHLQPQRPP